MRNLIVCDICSSNLKNYDGFNSRKFIRLMYSFENIEYNWNIQCKYDEYEVLIENLEELIMIHTILSSESTLMSLCMISYTDKKYTFKIDINLHDDLCDFFQKNNYHSTCSINKIDDDSNIMSQIFLSISNLTKIKV